MCACVRCGYCVGTSVACPWMNVWARVYECVRTRGSGYETLTGIWHTLHQLEFCLSRGLGIRFPFLYSLSSSHVARPGVGSSRQNHLVELQRENAIYERPAVTFQPYLIALSAFQLKRTRIRSGFGGRERMPMEWGMRLKRATDPMEFYLNL